MQCCKFCIVLVVIADFIGCECYLNVNMLFYWLLILLVVYTIFLHFLNRWLYLHGVIFLHNVIFLRFLNRWLYLYSVIFLHNYFFLQKLFCFSAEIVLFLNSADVIFCIVLHYCFAVSRGL